MSSAEPSALGVFYVSIYEGACQHLEDGNIEQHIALMRRLLAHADLPLVLRAKALLALAASDDEEDPATRVELAEEGHRLLIDDVASLMLEMGNELPQHHVDGALEVIEILRRARDDPDQAEGQESPGSEPAEDLDLIGDTTEDLDPFYESSEELDPIEDSSVERLGGHDAVAAEEEADDLYSSPQEAVVGQAAQGQTELQYRDDAVEGKIDQYAVQEDLTTTGSEKLHIRNEHAMNVEQPSGPAHGLGIPSTPDRGPPTVYPTPSRPADSQKLHISDESGIGVDQPSGAVLTFDSPSAPHRSPTGSSSTPSRPKPVKTSNIDFSTQVDRPSTPVSSSSAADQKYVPPHMRARSGLALGLPTSPGTSSTVAGEDKPRSRFQPLPKTPPGKKRELAAPSTPKSKRVLLDIAKGDDGSEKDDNKMDVDE